MVWGDNSFCQLGVENVQNKFMEIKNINFGVEIEEVSVGKQHTLMRTPKGELFVVGDNQRGQLGLPQSIAF